MIARDVVKLAARAIRSSKEAKSWLERDEFGSWEKQAQAWIDKTREQRERQGISDERAAEEFAGRLALEALQAVLVREKGKESRGKKS